MSSKFEIGDRVLSEKYGLGIVVDYSKNDGRALVQYDNANNKLHNGNYCQKSGRKYPYKTCFYEYDYTGYTSNNIELIEKSFTEDDISITVKVEKTIYLNILDDEFELTESEAKFIMKQLQKILGEL